MKKLMALIGVSLFAYFYINNALKGGSEESVNTGSKLQTSDKI